MHLRKLTFLIVTSFGLCLTRGFAQSENLSEPETVHRVKNLVTQVDKELNSPLGAHFAMSQIFSEIKAAPSFSRLVTVTTNNWKIVLDNWNVITVDENARLIQEHALLFLPPEEYLESLKRLLKLYEKSQVTKGELSMMLFRSENEKRWFLGANYRDKGVIELLDETARVFADDKFIPGLVKFYKSGKANGRDEKLRKGNDDAYLAHLPVPRLPATIEYERRTNNSPGRAERKAPMVILCVLVTVGIIYYLRKRRRTRA